MLQNFVKFWFQHWLVSLPCFRAKITQILRKVFPERWDEIETWFSLIWIAQRLNYFTATAYLFSILAIFIKNRVVKVERKVQTLGPPLFQENSVPSNFFQTMFLFARLLPQARMSAILDHIWANNGPKTFQRGPFHGCWIGTQNFENF